MKPVLLDTGPIVAMLDRSEQRHADCAELISQLDAPLVTCEAVLAEACYLLREVRGAAEAILENVECGNFLVPYRLTGRATKLARLMKKYADQPMDFADACLVDMAGAMGTGPRLTREGGVPFFFRGGNSPFVAFPRT